MADGRIKITRAGLAKVIAIDRPEARNALDPAMLATLLDEVSATRLAPDLRAIVLRGAGEGPFSSGYDLGAMPDEPLDGEAARALQAPIRDLANAIRVAEVPVIAAVRRFAFGASFDIVAHCDIRVSEAGARFALPAAKLGFVYPLEGVRQLTLMLGQGQAERVLLLAEELTAEELVPSGFVQRVWPAAEFESRLAALIEGLARLAPLSLKGLKQVIGMARNPAPGYVEAVAAAYEAMAASLNSADAREGPKALREKRMPRFEGR